MSEYKGKFSIEMVDSEIYKILASGLEETILSTFHRTIEVGKLSLMNKNSWRIEVELKDKPPKES